MHVNKDVCCVNVLKPSLLTHCFEVLSAVGCDGQTCGTVQMNKGKKFKFCKILTCTAQFRLIDNKVDIPSYPI